MIYGNLKIEQKGGRNNNIGEEFEIQAIWNLYQYMGIPKTEIREISLSEIESYRGEKIVLPINFAFLSFPKISPDIIPVYLGLYLISGTAAAGLKLREFAPIGCRDVHTLHELQKEEIPCYFSGCMTLTLPISVEGSEKRDKVFFVDAPKELLPYIPQKIYDEAVFLSHAISEKEDPEKAAKERYELYKKHAKLIVTRRIHCAMPAIAAGIPVVLVSPKTQIRSSVVKPFVHLYDTSEYPKIDWNPKPIEYEPLKKVMLEYAKIRVKAAYELKNVPETVHSYYQGQLSNSFSESLKDSGRHDMPEDVYCLEEWLNRHFSQKDTFPYIIWGHNQIAECFYQYMKSNYPNAVFSEFVDEFKEIEFHGKKSQHAKVIDQYSEAAVLVASYSASRFAKQYIESKKSNYFFSARAESYQNVLTGETLQLSV